MKLNLPHSITKIFTLPSANELALKEFEDAQRQLLQAQRERDYSTKLVEFYEMRLKALTERSTA